MPEVPANLLFFIASSFLLAMSLQHSYELGRLEETRTLAEEIARRDSPRRRGQTSAGSTRGGRST